MIIVILFSPLTFIFYGDSTYDFGLVNFKVGIQEFTDSNK